MYYFHLQHRFVFCISSDFRQRSAYPKVKPPKNMKIIILIAKLYFAAIDIYHTFTLEKNSGP